MEKNPQRVNDAVAHVEAGVPEAAGWVLNATLLLNHSRYSRALFTCNLCSRSGKVGPRSPTSLTSTEAETGSVTLSASSVTSAK